MGEPFAPSVLLVKHAGTRKGDLQNLEIKGGGKGSSRVRVCGRRRVSSTPGRVLEGRR